MGSFYRKFYSWRKEAKHKLILAYRWPEFKKVRKELYREELKTGCCNKLADYRAWKAAVSQFPEVDMSTFDVRWKQKHDNLRKIKNERNLLRKTVALEKKLPNNAQCIREIIPGSLKSMKKDFAKCKKLQKIYKKQEANRVTTSRKAFLEEVKKHQVLNSQAPVVTVVDQGPVDPIRDTKWVYANIGRLFNKNSLGLDILNENVLREAPSNGAISLAHYCLNERTAFFEKFVLKVLSMETSNSAPTNNEADLIDTHDPELAGLAQYIKGSM